VRGGRRGAGARPPVESYRMVTTIVSEITLI
jgi:hypothetical protein